MANAGPKGDDLDEIQNILLSITDDVAVENHTIERLTLLINSLNVLFLAYDWLKNTSQQSTFLKALANNKSLESFDCREKLDDKNLQLFSQILEKHTSLEKLTLKGFDLVGDRCKALAHIIKTNKSITELDIGGNQIDDEGAALIAQAVIFNNTLSKIEFHGGEGDKITQKGMDIIEGALLNNTALRHIYFFFPKFKLGAMFVKPERFLAPKFFFTVGKGLAKQQPSLPAHIVDYIMKFLTDGPLLQADARVGFWQGSDCDHRVRPQPITQALELLFKKSRNEENGISAAYKKRK